MPIGGQGSHRAAVRNEGGHGASVRAIMKRSGRGDVEHVDLEP